MDSPKSLPPLAAFPEAHWRSNLVPQEWEACLDAWIALTEAHLSLSDPSFSSISSKDESLGKFIHTYVSELAKSSPDIPNFDSPIRANHLRKNTYLLVQRLSNSKSVPKYVVDTAFLLDFSKAYGKRAESILASLWSTSSLHLENSLNQYKSTLTTQLESGIKGDPQKTELRLKSLNHLLAASPDSASFFLSGSDFLDALISCYQLMNPPLRKAIIATTYLCLIGLTKGEKPNFSAAIDTLYALKAAAEKHKAGPVNERESLVPELVSVTPILSHIRERIKNQESVSARAKPIIASLESYRKPVSGRPKKLIKRKIDKGKGKAPATVSDVPPELHAHRMSLVTQIQDLFPDLGDAFIVRLLDEYEDNVETVISHLLEDSLPPHLSSLDRSAKLPPTPALSTPHVPDLSPRPTPNISRAPSPLPERRNIYDNDELDSSAVEAGKLHFGRKDRGTADEALRDRRQAPDKAKILAVLAQFDSDDDERDDTYDTADVGGTIEVSGPDGVNLNATRAIGSTAMESGNDISEQDEKLYAEWKRNPGAFARDSATRRGDERARMKKETGMTDEALEGWAIMLSQDARRQRKLESQVGSFSGQQRQIQSTRWQDSPEGSDWDNPNNRGRGGRIRGAGRGRGGPGRERGGRGGGDVAGKPSDAGTQQARERKGENKGRGANHNRREGRARKVARAGFAG